MADERTRKDVLAGVTSADTLIQQEGWSMGGRMPGHSRERFVPTTAASRAEAFRIGAHWKMQPGRFTILLAWAVLASSLAFSPPASAIVVGVAPQDLVPNRDYASAVWTGSDIYVLGGRTNGNGPGSVTVANITRYDPASGSHDVAGSSLTIDSFDGAAVWTGSRAILIGGYRWGNGGGYGLLSNVTSFDPATGVVNEIQSLPGRRNAAAAVWTGAHIFLIAGYGDRYFNDILRLDPLTGASYRMNSTFLNNGGSRSAAYLAPYIYVFGGGVDGGPTDQIYRFHPVNDVIELLPTRLPTPRHDMASIVANGRVYLVGGLNANKEILEFDPTTSGGSIRVVGHLQDNVGFPRSAAAGEATFYLFGAYDFATQLPVGKVYRFTTGDVFNNAPVARIAVVVPSPRECQGVVTSVSLDASLSSDPDGNTLSFAWSAPGVTMNPTNGAVTTGGFPLGTTTARVEVSDGQIVSSATRDVTIADTNPPVTTPSPSGVAGGRGWWRSPVDVGLSVSDACARPTTPHWSLDGGPDRVPDPLIVAGDGSHP